MTIGWYIVDVAAPVAVESRETDIWLIAGGQAFGQVDGETRDDVDGGGQGVDAHDVEVLPPVSLLIIVY